MFAGVKSKLPELLFPLVNDAIFVAAGSKVTKFYEEAAKGWHDTRDSLSYVLTDYWFKVRPAPYCAHFEFFWLCHFTRVSPHLADYQCGAVQCSASRIAELAASSGQPAFVYRFEHILSFSELFPKFGIPTVCMNRTCHMMEVSGIMRD